MNRHTQQITETAIVNTKHLRPEVPVPAHPHRRRAFDIDFLVEEGVIDVEDRDLFWFAETAEDIWNGLLDWYHRCGEALVASD